MGTRHLIAVFCNGEYKVAQYGQWDGYPEGQGTGVLSFLHKMDEQRFRNQLQLTSWTSNEELNALKAKFMKGKGAKLFTASVSDSFAAMFPEFSRDTGSDILEYVYTSEFPVIKLHNDITFAADSLFCEWAYVIDMDKRTFEVYVGFNHEELTPADRFYFLREYENKFKDEDAPYDGAKQYHGVKMIKMWSFDALPTEEEFLDSFKGDDDA